MEYYSAIKKNKNNAICSNWMDLGIIIRSEVKSEREKKIPYITYMWNINYDINEVIYKIKLQTHGHIE